MTEKTELEKITEVVTILVQRMQRVEEALDGLNPKWRKEKCN